MKLHIFSFLLLCGTAFASDPLLANSERLVQALGLETSITNLPTVHWTMPTNAFVFGELSGLFHDYSGNGDCRLVLTNSAGLVFARIELHEYPSNAEALVCLSFLAGGGGTVLPEDIATLTTVRTNDLGVVEIGELVEQSAQQHAWKWCLFRNQGLECRVVQGVDAMSLSMAVLRAGGVNIPEEPSEPPSP